MNATALLQEDVLSTTNIESTKLKAIELTLFSYQMPLNHFEEQVANVCDTHFDYHILANQSNEMTFAIYPKEYCLVEGGMMYKSANSIMSDLVNKGLLVKCMKAIED